MANLTQLRMLEELNGFLLVDKPAGIAFSTVVKTVKRKFNLVKVGHGGSLDTMASGLLILLINDANKFVGEVMGADRAYEGTVRFGLRTNTGDIYGAKTGEGARELPDLAAFRGDLFQVEPRFAAIRREGAAEYEVVDTGEHAQFLTHVYRLDFEAERFRLVASKSLIVRALMDELGVCLASLRRTRIGKFEVANAIAFDRLLETDLKDFAACVTPLSQALR